MSFPDFGRGNRVQQRTPQRRLTHRRLDRLQEVKNGGASEEIEIARERMFRRCAEDVPERQAGPIPPHPLPRLVVQIVKNRRPPPRPPHPAMCHDQPDERRQRNHRRRDRQPAPHPDRPDRAHRERDESDETEVGEPVPPSRQVIALCRVALAPGCVEVTSICARLPARRLNHRASRRAPSRDSRFWFFRCRRLLMRLR
jgi:hypothetical protein